MDESLLTTIFYNYLSDAEPNTHKYFSAQPKYPPLQWAPSVLYLADEDVGGFEVAAEHLRCLSGDRFDLHTDLLPFLGRIDRFVVHLNAGDHTNVHKLRHKPVPIDLKGYTQ